MGSRLNWDHPSSGRRPVFDPGQIRECLGWIEEQERRFSAAVGADNYRLVAEGHRIDAGLVRGDRRALHAHAVLLDRVGGIHGDLVVGGIAVLHAEGHTAIVQPYLHRLDELGGVRLII